MMLRRYHKTEETNEGLTKLEDIKLTVGEETEIEEVQEEVVEAPKKETKKRTTKG